MMTKNRANVGAPIRLLALTLVCVGLASCSSTGSSGKSKSRSKEYFAESEYGVKASPRLASGKNIPKGGGRYMVGKPYKVRGKTYVPKLNPDYDKVGLASWYGSAFHGRMTANGELYDQNHLSAAHPTMPLPSYARVTNVENGTSVMVRVNDRGPFHPGRIIDVSDKTAELLDLKHSGTANVRVQYVGPAQMDGHDMPYLMASYSPKGSRLPQVAPDGLGGPGVMVASNDASIGLPRTSTVLVAPTPAPTPVAAPAAVPAGVATATAFGTLDAGQGDPFAQFLLLPEIGPLPFDRPDDSFQPAASLASAYVSLDSAPSALAFEAILVRDERLTEQAIQDFAKRRAASASE